MDKNKAFTLIELLVVITIIAVLISIMVPALKETKKQAQSTVCKSNMRQIGTAAMLYAENNNSYIPRGGTGGTWFQLFLPYLGHEHNKGDYREVKIYRCPAFPDKKQTVCYVISSWTFDDSNDMTGEEIWEPTKLNTFHRPASTIYMADNEDGWWRPIIEDEKSTYLYLCDVWHPTHISSSNSEDILHGRRVSNKRHREGSNCIYIDGHVDWIKGSDMTINMWKDK